MSKKIAEGTESLVLDVKTGSGAFMKTKESAVSLAAAMVDIGRKSGVTTSALVTDMSTPLGRSAGNSVETREAIECLNGGGPNDLRELTLLLAEEMLRLSGVVGDPEKALSSGEAMRVFERMVKAQGGDLSKEMPLGKMCLEVKAESDGYITQMDAMSVGLAAWRLGAGRSVQGDGIDYGAGVTWEKTVGDQVCRGETIFKLYSSDPSKVELATDALSGAVIIGEGRVARRDIVLSRVDCSE
jgi:thymidine phosphorylase